MITLLNIHLNSGVSVKTRSGLHTGFFELLDLHVLRSTDFCRPLFLPELERISFLIFFFRHFQFCRVFDQHRSVIVRLDVKKNWTSPKQSGYLPSILITTRVGFKKKGNSFSSEIGLIHRGRHFSSLLDESVFLLTWRDRPFLVGLKPTWASAQTSGAASALLGVCDVTSCLSEEVSIWGFVTKHIVVVSALQNPLVFFRFCFSAHVEIMWRKNVASSSSICNFLQPNPKHLERFFFFLSNQWRGILLLRGRIFLMFYRESKGLEMVIYQDQQREPPITPNDLESQPWGSRKPQTVQLSSDRGHEGRCLMASCSPHVGGAIFNLLAFIERLSIGMGADAGRRGRSGLVLPVCFIFAESLLLKFCYFLIQASSKQKKRKQKWFKAGFLSRKRSSVVTTAEVCLD